MQFDGIVYFFVIFPLTYSVSREQLIGEAVFLEIQSSDGRDFLFNVIVLQLIDKEILLRKIDSGLFMTIRRES